MNTPSVFYIWFKGFQPAAMDVDSRYPAQYPPKNPDGTDPEGPIILLFVRGCKEVTGEDPEATLELFNEGLNHPFDPESSTGLTKDELLARFDYLISLEPSATEVVALQTQCDLIYNERFKTESELGIE
ncbi:MAG: hypothetical protein ACJAV1_002722 [Paraglaciecola sp.]|jgi:hypothetical protein